MPRDRGATGHVDHIQPDRIRTRSVSPGSVGTGLKNTDDALDPLRLGNVDAATVLPNRTPRRANESDPGHALAPGDGEPARWAPARPWTWRGAVASASQSRRKDRFVKADPAVQRRLLDLAEVDAELSRLAHRRRTLPEHAELTAAEAAVRTAKDKLVEVETAAGDLDRDIRRLERDVEGVRSRTVRDNQLLAGAGIGAKQASDLQHELETLARRQTVLEDEQLEVMEQREAVGSDVDHSRVVLAGAEQELTAITERRDTLLVDIDTAERGRVRAREEVVTTLPADVLAVYERRREHRGVGAAALVARRCQACRLELDRTSIAELKAAPADELVSCEECGVILVRTEGSGL
jgi:uncharacterized protein